MVIPHICHIGICGENLSCGEISASVSVLSHFCTFAYRKMGLKIVFVEKLTNMRNAGAVLLTLLQLLEVLET